MSEPFSYQLIRQLVNELVRQVPPRANVISRNPYDFDNKDGKTTTTVTPLVLGGDPGQVGRETCGPRDELQPGYDSGCGDSVHQQSPGLSEVRPMAEGESVRPRDANSYDRPRHPAVAPCPAENSEPKRQLAKKWPPKTDAPTPTCGGCRAYRCGTPLGGLTRKLSSEPTVAPVGFFTETAIQVALILIVFALWREL